MKFRIAQLDATTWELFINGGQCGQYGTARAAKAAARRHLSAWHPPLRWRATWDTPESTPVWHAERP